MQFDLLPGYDPYRDAGDIYYYDEKAGAAAVAFIEKELKFTKGKWKGKPFILSGWQKQTIACLFGWKVRATGLRRYQTFFLYIPRKNGKSELVAAIGNTIFFCDGENDAEIYIGARDRGQALTLYRMCERMLRQNDDLWEDVRPKESTKEILARWDDSKIQAVSSDALSIHSLSPSVSIIDELHTQPNGKLVEALTTGMGGREQPLTIYLTTADVEGESICNDELEYAQGVRDGTINDPRYLPVIFETDKDEDWLDEKVWAKANPNYPVTPNPEYLRGFAKKAKVSKRKELSFRRLFLNQKTTSLEGWLNMDCWRMCADKFEESELYNQKCYGGIDLSSKTDLTTAQFFFPDSWRVISRFYLPRKALENDKSGHYQEWYEAGYLQICGEEYIDYDYIMRDVVEIYRLHDVKGCGIDNWNASYFITRIEKHHNIELTSYTQGMKSFNEPSKEFETMVETKRLRHNNPVLSWNAVNVSIKEDENGNIRPVKPKRGSALKVDGIVALIMAIGLWVVDRQEEPADSVYNTRDMIVL